MVYYIISKIMKVFSIINWEWLKLKLTGKRFNLTLEDIILVTNKIGPDYYLILTRKDAHLSTYLVNLGHFLKTGNWGFWSHILMNVDNSVDDVNKFLFCEATGTGVHTSKLMDVLNCDAVCLLKLTNYTAKEFTECTDDYLDDVGKEYDCLFDMLNANKMSCVEFVRDQLLHLSNYDQRMTRFRELVCREKSITPDMFYSCMDFEIVLEIRR